ncbi:MAG: SpoIIE family protein phosphatase [Acidobacteriota bacterium]
MRTASPKRTRWTLAFKLGMFVLVGTSIVFGLAFGYNFYSSRLLILGAVENAARSLSASTVQRIEAVLKGVETMPRFMALELERRQFDADGLVDFIHSNLVANPDVYGSTVAYEPYAFKKDSYYFAPYWSWQGGELGLSWLGADTYRFHFHDWYLIPKEVEAPVWSEPYFDEGGGNILMTTYSVPFYGRVDWERKFRGVVTADISLDWLVNIISTVQLFKSGYAFLISQNGVFVAHPDMSMVMRESIFSMAEAAGDPELRRIGREMIHGGQGFVRLDRFHRGRPAWLYYAPLPALGWSIGVVFPEEALFTEIHDLFQRVVLIGIGGFAALFAVIILISTTMTRPIRSLARTTAEIAKGNLDVVLPTVNTRDEVGDLSRSFDNMRVALKEYISHLTETTAAKERYESELKIARSIQMSFLPKKFPPFPEREEFDIYATLEPAKEVGGDLYDFFLLDDGRLFFSIGDVSDKGVPAALFMAVTKTLMKGVATQVFPDPAMILSRVNEELCKENDSMMFATVFCAILDIASGELWYSSAGHNPPVLARPGAEPMFITVPPGVVLGAMEGMQYRPMKMTLQPEDTLILYTDGVTEATDLSVRLYGDHRLIETVRAHSDESAESVVNAIMASVKRFAEGAPQSDDITILALRYRPRRPRLV